MKEDRIEGSYELKEGGSLYITTENGDSIYIIPTENGTLVSLHQGEKSQSIDNYDFDDRRSCEGYTVSSVNNGFTSVNIFFDQVVEDDQ